MQEQALEPLAHPPMPAMSHEQSASTAIMVPQGHQQGGMQIAADSIIGLFRRAGFELVTSA